jgi:two-component system, cell cycle response regulator
VKILVAEDDLTSRTLLKTILTSWGFEVSAVADGEEAWQVLSGASAPRLAILDWMMPGLDGLEVCRRIRAADSPHPPYLVLLTARGSKEDIVAGLEAGADDHVGKPFDRDELRARLHVGQRFTELNEKLMQTQRTLEKQANTDVLTGGMNRRAVLERLKQELARAKRQETSVSVGLLDVDHFKQTNDTFGHAVGDLALQWVVKKATRAMRPYDGFGRFGGEEFLAIVPGVHPAKVKDVLERIRLAIGSSPADVGGQPIEVRVSIGGATSRGGSVDELIRAADDALYEAKAKGRNRVEMDQDAPAGRLP